jgi:hypothetical protein
MTLTAKTVTIRAVLRTHAGRSERRPRAMLIALLAVLGVDLIVLVAFAALVLGRRRWLKRQPGEFAGAIRVTSGEIHRLGLQWKARFRSLGPRHPGLEQGTAPLMLRNELVPVDGLSGERPARSGEVKRLGDEPAVLAFAFDDATIEVAAKAEHRVLVTGPVTDPARRCRCAETQVEWEDVDGWCDEAEYRVRVV